MLTRTFTKRPERSSYNSAVNKAIQYKNPDDPRYKLEDIGKTAKIKKKSKSIGRSQVRISKREIVDLKEIIINRTVDFMYSASKLKLLQRKRQYVAGDERLKIEKEVKVAVDNLM